MGILGIPMALLTLAQELAFPIIVGALILYVLGLFVIYTFKEWRPPPSGPDKRWGGY